MTPDQMRIEIARHPDWGPLDVLRECFGVEPTALQKSFAVADPKTVAHIPDQLERFHRLWGARFPALAISNEQIAPFIKVGRFVSGHLTFSEAHVVKSLVRNPFARKWLMLSARFFPVHPVVRLYFEVEGRPPDPEGLAFWMASGLHGDELTRAFVSASGRG